MFKRRTKGLQGSGNVKPPFDEPFWHWYADSYSRSNNYREIEGLLKPTTKKITSNSTAVTTIIKYFETLKLNPIPSSNQVVALLKSPFTQGDITKTFHLIRFYQLSSDGLFITNEGADKFGGVINYVGAENWENVMCYLDALLFSMFANLESFEPMLFISNQHDNYLNNQLGALLRLYVNLLRSGNLITTDLTIRICETLKKLGFDEAMSHKQQDSATLFEFLTETLLMPLLTFKIDIKHGGKSDKDDRKYSKERILFVSIPEDDIDDSKIPVDKSENKHVEDPEQKRQPDDVNHEETDDDDEEEDGILLEECLEHYFNNSISVKRELERRATFESNKRLSDLTANLGDVTINDIPEVVESNKFEPTHDHIEVSESPQRHRSDSKNQTRFQTRTRSSTLSLWSTNNPDSDQTSKEVSLPAWMFLRLLPFYTDDNDLNQLNESVAKSSTEFAKRKPILPICLKRYSFNPQNSQANRSQKRIIIPPIINLPQFVADDINDEISGEYKLILESALCHRGTSISSGHFVSAIRKNTHNINQLDDEASNATWYLYDDMKKKSRVVEKSFKDIFSTEWPYMLFYRLVSIDESNNKFNSSTSSLLLKNNNAGGSSNASINSNPIIPPKGFKTKYWSEENNDETLTPIMSISNSNVASTSNVASIRSEEISSLNKINSLTSDSSSIPIPDIPPTDSKFVDIRDKYFWYVTDQNKNYFKELPNPTPTTKSSSHRDFSINLNVGISTRVRRNSQWSDTASFSNANTDNNPNSITNTNPRPDLNELNEKLSNIQQNNPDSGSNTSKWKISLKSKATRSTSNIGSPYINSPNANNSEASLDQKVSPIHLESSSGDQVKKSHVHRIFSHEHESDSKKHKKTNCKRDEYKKEKCAIM